MSKILSRAAVGALDAKDAGEILGHYLETNNLVMAQSHTASAAADQPSGKGVGDNLIKPK